MDHEGNHDLQPKPQRKGRRSWRGGRLRRFSYGRDHLSTDETENIGKTVKKMNGHLLTLVFCGVPTLLLTIVVAVLGDLNRRRIAKNMMEGFRKGHFSKGLGIQASKNISKFSLFALISIAGLFATFFLVILNRLPISSLYTIGILVFLMLTGAVNGILLFKEVMDNLDSV